MPLMYVKYLQVAAAIGIAQPVHAIFKNGVVYRYAPGRTVKLEDLKNPSIIKYVALKYSNFDLKQGVDKYSLVVGFRSVQK